MDSNDRQHLAEQTFPAQLDQLSPIGEFVTAAASCIATDKRVIFAVQMAVDEAATNIMIHGYEGKENGAIRICCWQEGDDFVVEMRDRGQPFDSAQVAEPDLHSPLEERREGGLGVYLMRRMMDHVSFSRQGGENVLTMIRHCTPSASLFVRTAVVSPKGRIDATTSPHLEQMLQGAIKANQPFVVVDLSQTTYVSSSALRVLLIAAKQLRQQGGNLLLCCAQPAVTRVLRMTGFAEIFTLYQTREAALQALEVPGGAQVPQ